MNVTKVGRIGAVTGVALLVASQLFVAAASAGSNTRYVWIGSSYDGTIAGEGGDCDTAIGNPARVGTLELSPVTAGGGQTHFGLDVVNCGGQNLSNLRLTVGKAPMADGQVALDVPADRFATDDGVVISETFGKSPSGLDCNDASPSTLLLTCSLKSLGAGAQIHLDVVLSTTSTTSITDTTGPIVWAVAKVAENTNDNGTNQDTFEAGTLDAEHMPTPLAYTGNCDNVSSYLSPHVHTAGTCPIGNTPEQTQIVYKSGKNGAVNVQDTTTTPPLEDCTAADGLDPIGSKFSVATITGESTNDDVIWTVTVDLKATNQNGTNPDKIVICHWDTGGQLVGSTRTTDLCSALPDPTDTGVDPMCTMSTQVVNNNGHKILTVVFRTPGNGLAKMW